MQRAPAHSPQPDNFVQDVINTQQHGAGFHPQQNKDLPPLKGVKNNLISDPAMPRNSQQQMLVQDNEQYYEDEYY